MKIYIGKWDWLNEDGLEGYNEIVTWSEQRTKEFIKNKMHHHYNFLMAAPDPIVGTYTFEEFEDAFNQDLEGNLNTKDYWIKIF